MSDSKWMSSFVIKDYCFLLSVATDDKDGTVLKLKKNWANFFLISFDVMLS